MAGFYKKDINQLFYAPEVVNGENYTLRKRLKDSYTFPVHGWYWFDNEIEARDFFDLPPLSESISVPNYLKFWDDLIASSIYQVIRQKAVNSLEVTVACTEFVAAIADAKIGRPNHDAIQACIYLLVSASNFTQSEIEELQELMTVNKLNYLYTLTLPTP